MPGLSASAPADATPGDELPLSRVETAALATNSPSRPAGVSPTPIDRAGQTYNRR